MPEDVYLQSALRRAGVRFDVNLIDTVLVRLWSRSIAWLTLIAALLTVYLWEGNLIGLSVATMLATRAVWLLGIGYLIVHFGRGVFYYRWRKRLRRDDAPLTVEAYAVVALDEYPDKPCRSAVVYKESGSVKPRFFTGPVCSPRRRPEFRAGQVALVFLDRRRPQFYSLDDGSAFKPVAKRARAGRMMGLATAAPPLSPTTAVRPARRPTAGT